jgi:S-methyl-5-thioribose-1-phosphate isomerase
MRCPALLADRFNTLHYDVQRRLVVLLDRRRYPFAVEFVECRTIEAVARAVEEMVVQGGPPLAYAAGLGLALAAFQNSEQTTAAQRGDLQAAAARLLATRPTADDLHHLIPQALQRGETALNNGVSAGEAILTFVNAEIEHGNQVSRACGEQAAELIADGDCILTHCFAGAALAWMLWTAKEQGKQIRLYPTETRPYLQGARLTVASAKEMGIPCTLIMDNMPAFMMSRGLLNKFICAADRITLDGHISNKIGTYQIALAAHQHQVPFYVLGYDGPDPRTATGADIPIEERNPEEIFFASGVDVQEKHSAKVRTAVEGVEGYYPAFDITPPELITGIVTDRGLFAPDEIRRYLEKK